MFEEIQHLDTPFTCYYEGNGCSGPAAKVYHKLHSKGVRECTPAVAFPLCDRHAFLSWKEAQTVVEQGMKCYDCGTKYELVSDIIVAETEL